MFIQLAITIGLVTGFQESSAVTVSANTSAKTFPLGPKISALPGFRPERKFMVERWLGSLQDLYKPYRKGRGYVEKDVNERGVSDSGVKRCGRDTSTTHNAKLNKPKFQRPSPQRTRP